MILFVRSTDKVIVGNPKRLIEFFEFSDVLINKYLWRKPTLFCGTQYLISMLVGSREKKRIQPAHSPIARNNVRKKNFVCKSNMRPRIRICDRGCYVEFFFHPVVKNGIALMGAVLPQCFLVMIH